MSSLDFKPSINYVRFVESQTENDNIHNMKNFEGVMEIAMDLEIGGLNLLLDSSSQRMIPFYLTFVTYSQVGGRGIVFHNNYSEYFSEERLLNGENEENMFVFVTKFRRNDYSPEESYYDFTSTAFKVAIIYSSTEITDVETLSENLFQPYNLLFETKLPFINDSPNRLGDIYGE